jgi:uncharacterized DUF497 family protein
MFFEWDPKKERANFRKHGVSFAQARQLLESDVDYLEIFDEAHSVDEDRFIAIGPIDKSIILVVWTERVESIVRIISARWATRGEERLYRRYVDGDR